MVNLLITRDVRTGEPYNGKDPAEIANHYPNEYCDIAVEVSIEQVYHGSGERDDPSSVELGGARVTRDCPYYDAEGDALPGKAFFEAGQEIELSDAEQDEAREIAMEEAREGVY